MHTLHIVLSSQEYSNLTVPEACTVGQWRHLVAIGLFGDPVPGAARLHCRTEECGALLEPHVPLPIPPDQLYVTGPAPVVCALEEQLWRITTSPHPKRRNLEDQVRKRDVVTQTDKHVEQFSRGSRHGTCSQQDNHERGSESSAWLSETCWQNVASHWWQEDYGSGAWEGAEWWDEWAYACRIQLRSALTGEVLGIMSSQDIDTVADMTKGLTKKDMSPTVNARFVYKGRRLFYHERPAELGLNHGDSVDVVYQTCVIITSSVDGTVKQWAGNDCTITLSAQPAGVLSLDCSLSANVVVASSSDKTVRVWRLSSGEFLQQFSAFAAISMVSLSTSGLLLLVTCVDVALAC